MTKRCAPTHAFAEIDATALAHNFRTVAALGKRVIAVVKANAYGHGLDLAVPTFLLAGCDFFAVATLDEALSVRALAPHADILILGYTPPEAAPLLTRENLTQAVFSAPYAKALSANATSPVSVHLKIDGGMRRLGFAFDDREGISFALQAQKLRTCGLFTHLPSVLCNQKGTRVALAKFSAISRDLPHLVAHAAASSALPINEAHFDAVRPGLALYGFSPFLSLRPAMCVHAPLVQIRHVQKGDPVGYDGAFVAPRDLRVGVLPIGYADGLPRNAKGHAVQLPLKKTAPVIGHICMDQCMVDLTDTDAKEGDTVCVIPDFAALASRCDTIVYESLATLSPRVSRRLKEV